tara:strand:- start:10805 stop:11656 length:852 start_codon:yes stop_codon:yes gene_type:complete
MIKELFVKTIEKLSNSLNCNLVLKNYTQIFGGSINTAFLINTNIGKFFLKFNINKVKNLFDKEVRGLKLISLTNTIKVPNVIYFDEEVLALDFIESNELNQKFWSSFGYSLSELHYNTFESFGLDHNNFIGSLLQKNNFHTNWSDFFINQRLKPQLEIGNFSVKTQKLFESLFLKLENIFPITKPSLLHGDLWNGNFISSKDQVFVIDPAVYYGNREMDIAMTKLFGGFNKEFYDTYNYYYPLDKNWKIRLDICNLYPLLVHANLFGGNYYNQINSILKSVTK